MVTTAATESFNAGFQRLRSVEGGPIGTDNSRLQPEIDSYGFCQSFQWSDVGIDLNRDESTIGFSADGCCHDFAGKTEIFPKLNDTYHRDPNRLIGKTNLIIADIETIMDTAFLKLRMAMLRLEESPERLVEIGEWLLIGVFRAFVDPWKCTLFNRIPQLFQLRCVWIAAFRILFLPFG